VDTRLGRPAHAAAGTRVEDELARAEAGAPS
jgi:hypothetical protein